MLLAGLSRLCSLIRVISLYGARQQRDAGRPSALWRRLK